MFVSERETKITKRSNCMESDATPLLSKWFGPKFSQRGKYFKPTIILNVR